MFKNVSKILQDFEKMFGILFGQNNSQNVLISFQNIQIISSPLVHQVPGANET